jgi:hypothetical protein
MNTTTLKSAGMLASVFFAGLAFASEPKQDNCSQPAGELNSAITAKPAEVVTLVYEKVAATPACACEFVKTAIKAAKADDSTTGQIVEAAIAGAPDQYKVIVECAIAVKPTAAGHIRAALQSVFGGKGGKGSTVPMGKGGKVVVVEPPPEAKMNPALLMAFILDGISPSMIGKTDGITSGLAGAAAVPGGGASGTIFAFPRPIPETSVTPTEPEPEEEEKPTRPRPRPPGPATPSDPVPFGS